MQAKELLMLFKSLEQNPEQLNRRHLKKLYALLIAAGQYPICPWCQEYIYDINDFTWDHIVPKAAGGGDSLDNLQPMHKHCNNASKCDCVYQVEYHYDIQSELEETVLSVRVAVCKRQEPKRDKKKVRYNNNKRRTNGRGKRR
jgi:hypothetical protein